MRFLILLVVMLTTTSYASEVEKLNDINELRWKNRVILLLSTEDDKRNKALLSEFDEAVIDRDLVWFIVNDKQVFSNYAGGVSEQFTTNINKAFSLEEYPVLLIGKDGGIKNKAQKFELELLFSSIDRMPMRQQEMLQKNEK
ncbi:DUF4174 domain-containing protein [Psychromonas arctica]|uniref:DUF4174 domain-containing protein n=1 Tax=Psychromonas arctica TaxID=168275 RepID=UPI002FD04197